MTIEAITSDKLDVHYRQAIAPMSSRGSFLADDTDNHDFNFPSRGKSILGITMDNPADQALTWTLYGKNDEAGVVGEPDVVQLDTDAIAAASKANEGFNGFAFPFYLLRLAYAVGPGDVPKKTTSVFINLTS